MDLSLISYFLPLHDNAVLNALTELITMLAEDTIIILVGAFLYWCVDPKAGQRMACTAIGGVFWTMGLKNYLKIPRPWDLGLISKDQVLRVSTATSYSFPSGHTTAGTNIYGYFAKDAKKTWVKVALWTLVGLI
ncbi:MAG: phosphatase PAP2 family protein, partial [Clostridia bacterium]|nr:phosphatase PAP2 family protein [Clostridia bacterium]